MSSENSNWEHNFKEQWQASISLKQSVLNNPSFWESLQKVAATMANCFARKKKLLIAGNGGSAADAQHFAAELVGRFVKERPGLPAIALTTDTSAITAWSNDYSYESYFARAVQALAQPGDLFLGISTSGNSKNIIRALEYCNSNNIVSLALVGNTGGQCAKLATQSIIIPSNETARIQECHIAVVHMLCSYLDEVSGKQTPAII